MDQAEWLLLPLGLAGVFATSLWLLVRRGGPGSPRSWWANPWVWLGISAGSLALGVLLWSGLLFGPVLFLPIVWVWRPRRAAPVDPRTNGHSGRSGPTTPL